MLEREFELETALEIERFYLHNNFLEEKHIVTMKDVEEAQQKIVNIIRKLEDSAEIIISRGGGDEIVV